MTQEIVTVIRPSFKKICADSSCQAAIFNHALYWIAKKCKEGCNYWYDTGENIYHALAETWGISIIRREINALVDSHLIGETNNPKWGADRTKHFYFGEEQATTLFHACEKHEVCLFCIGLCEDVLALIAPHLIDLTNAIIRFNKCICQNHQMQVIDLLNASDRSIKAITKISSKITYKEKDTKESSDAPFVASPSSSSEQPQAPSYSQDSYKTSNTKDVTQVSQESEPAHGHAVTAAPDLPGDDCRRIVGTQHPLSASVDIPLATGRKEPGIESHGYEKGGRDEPGTDGIWDRDASGSGRDTALHPAPDQHCVGDSQEQAIQETQAAQEVTQQTPLSQGLAPALDGDARESSTPPVATALLLSHTLQGTSLLGEMSLDALLSQPRGERTEIKTLLSQVRGQMTRMTQGEPIRAGDTSSDATSQSTETAPMKPVSQNKTVQDRKNKKVPEGPPAFPAPDAPWNAEAAVEIVEAKKGRRYGDTTRAQELMEAKKVLKMDFNGEPLTRKQFEDAWDAMAGWAFWKEHTNVKPMIRTLRKDDKIIAILEELNQKKTKSNGGGNGSPSSSGGSTNGIRPTISGKRRLDINDTPPLAAAHTSARSQIWA